MEVNRNTNCEGKKYCSTKKKTDHVEYYPYGNDDVVGGLVKENSTLGMVAMAGYMGTCKMSFIG